jgi:hypothetical protein
LGFGFEPCLVFDVCVQCRGKEFLDARKRASCGRRAGFDGFVGTVEIVPGQGLHIGAENKVRVTLPDFELMFLGSTNGAADDLKYVGGCATLSVFEADRDANHMRGAEFPGG